MAGVACPGRKWPEQAHPVARLTRTSEALGASIVGSLQRLTFQLVEPTESSLRGS